MKWIYGIGIFVLGIMLLIIYFINLVYLSSTRMFLFSTTSNVPLSLGLLIIVIISYFLGIFTILFIKTLIKSKPKDIFDEDI